LRLVGSYPIIASVLKMTDDVAIVHEAHGTILRAIKDNNPKRSEEAMCEHIRSGRLWLEAMARKEPFQSRWIVWRRPRLVAGTR
jgi:DNA-binding FadR family transcriptional regulator